MVIKKRISPRKLFYLSLNHILLFGLWSTLILVLYETLDFTWVVIPWLPFSIIGTAVAFFVGFKNNSAYDRLWEARKIWGGIVNDSRSWAITVRGFIHTSETQNKESIKRIHKKLIYRHIAWLNALKNQLWKSRSWEIISSKLEKERRINLAVFGNESLVDDLKHFIPEQEITPLLKVANPATQLLDSQSEEIKKLYKSGVIDSYKHVSLQNVLTRLYAEQGKCERIKNFPFPRQYASSCYFLVMLFIYCIPLAFVGEFDNLGHDYSWLTVPFTMVVGWVFYTIDLVGDLNENPFAGLDNDIPMHSLCRTIEIDLKEMLKEDKIPRVIEPLDDIIL